MIKSENIALRFHECFRVANMRAKPRRHFRCRFEQRGESRAVRRDDRIRIVKNIIIYRTGVGVDRHLYTVANIVSFLPVRIVMPRIWKAVGGCISINDPHKTSVVVNDNIRIGIVAEKGSYAADPVDDIAVHHNAAFGRNVVGKRQFGQIVGGPRDAQTAEAAPDRKPAVAVVICIVVTFTLRVIKLSLLCLYINKRVRTLAKVDLRPRHTYVAG